MLTVSLNAAWSQETPGWARRIREDHPRLFFNADTFAQVKERALSREKPWFGRFRAHADWLIRKIGGQDQPQPHDWGSDSAQAAFVYLVTQEKKYLDLAKRALDTALRYYEKCYENRKPVNWYSTTRVHATMTWDWLYNDLSAEEREAYLSRLVRAVQDVLRAKPRIYRENYSGYTTGFYGIRNCLWFIGCTAYGTGIEEKQVNEWLVWGREENLRLLAHRRKACGDDGGGASPTLGYVLGAYPWSEQNFFYTWLSATGENLAPDWPHSAWLANYVVWNWIETSGQPLEFGWGDTPHTTNRLPTWQLYTHLANIRHLYGRETHEAAALARHVQSLLPSKSYSPAWFIYPFLLTNLETSPEPFKPESLPHARHFEGLGQVFMRSGTGADDTYCLFTCGGILRQHRHYDALNFIIYHQGHLALDSGTRYSETANGQHLKNYYAQTVAHNCVLIHQPDEPPANYWGSGPRVAANHGGQHSQLGSAVRAFETNDHFVYVAGDGTGSYRHGAPNGLPQKTDLVTRQLVFLMPSHFVIFDRVNATNAAYKKRWLLHTAHRPVVDDKTIRADHGQGRMFCKTLLPQDATLALVGGPGKEFWAAGRNWGIQTGKLKPENLAMMGQWRLEVSPGTAREYDAFLHVIQVGGQDLEVMSDSQVIRGEGSVGVRLATAQGAWETTFKIAGELGGHLRLTGGETTLDQALTQRVTPQVGIRATEK